MGYALKVLAIFAWSLVSAITWDGPAPTQSLNRGIFELVKRGNDHLEAGRNPIPTAEPVAFSEAHWRRQTTSLATSSSPGPICGFVSGSTSNWYSCSKFCAVATAQHAWGCCRSLAGCTLQTACVPQSSLASCADDSVCVQDAFRTKCDAVSPYCNEFVIQGAANVAVTLWQCDSTPSTAILAATATDGNSSALTYNYIQMTVPTYSASTSTSSTSRQTSTTTTISSSSSSSSSTPIPTPTPTQEPKPVPIGAIVGGVIGGLALLAIILMLIFFLLRRRKDPAPASREIQSPPAPVAEITYTRPDKSSSERQLTPAEKHTYQPQIVSPLSPESPQFQQQSRLSPEQYPSELYSGPSSPTPQYAPYSPPPPSTPFPGVSEVDGTSAQRIH